MTMGEASGPLFGHSALPERTPGRPWRIAAGQSTLRSMIEHVDSAMRSWLADVNPPIEATLTLAKVREQRSRRDNYLADVRADDGRVVGRRRATRFFELDYRCTLVADTADSHRSIGGLLQLLVDHESIPGAHLGTELSELGTPIEVAIAASEDDTSVLVVRVVLPVNPTVDGDVGPPTTALYLDLVPPSGQPRPLAEETIAPVPAPGDRTWTTVRRRELIGRATTSVRTDGPTS